MISLRVCLLAICLSICYVALMTVNAEDANQIAIKHTAEGNATVATTPNKPRFRFFRILRSMFGLGRRRHCRYGVMNYARRHRCWKRRCHLPAPPPPPPPPPRPPAPRPRPPAPRPRPPATRPRPPAPRPRPPSPQPRPPPPQPRPPPPQPQPPPPKPPPVPSQPKPTPHPAHPTPPSPPGYPPNYPNYPPSPPGYPPNYPNNPSGPPSYPPNYPNYPPGAPLGPPSCPYSPNNPNNPSGPCPPAYPPNSPNYPPNQPGYPPNYPNYPPSQPGYPPNYPNYPPSTPFGPPSCSSSYSPNYPNDPSRPPSCPPSTGSNQNPGWYIDPGQTEWMQRQKNLSLNDTPFIPCSPEDEVFSDQNQQLYTQKYPHQCDQRCFTEFQRIATEFKTLLDKTSKLEMEVVEKYLGLVKEFREHILKISRRISRDMRMGVNPYDFCSMLLCSQRKFEQLLKFVRACNTIQARTMNVRKYKLSGRKFNNTNSKSTSSVKVSTRNLKLNKKLIKEEHDKLISFLRDNSKRMRLYQAVLKLIKDQTRVMEKFINHKEKKKTKPPSQKHTKTLQPFHGEPLSKSERTSEEILLQKKLRHASDMLNELDNIRVCILVNGENGLKLRTCKHLGDRLKLCQAALPEYKLYIQSFGKA